VKSIKRAARLRAVEAGMAKKWYDYFVSVDRSEERQAQDASAPEAPRIAAQTGAEIASGVAAEPKFSTPVTKPTSFEEIYHAAEITAAPHVYTIFNVAEMLQSVHFRVLTVDVKRNFVLLL